MKSFMWLAIIIALIGSIASPGIAASDEQSLSKTTFFVTWYDVGKSALEELEGIHEVTKGFQGGKEINTVLFNSSEVNPDKMKNTLKKAGTYIGTADTTDDWIKKPFCSKNQT